MKNFIFLIQLQAQTIASAFAIQLVMALYCPLGGMGKGPQKPGFIFKPHYLQLLSLGISRSGTTRTPLMIALMIALTIALMIYRDQGKCKVKEQRQKTDSRSNYSS